MKIISTFIYKARISFLLSNIIRVLLIWVLFAYGALLVWCGGDYLFVLRLFYRRMYFVFIAAAGAYLLVRFVLSNKKYLKGYDFIVLLQNVFPELKDDLINAWQLFYKRPDGVSEELISKLIESTEEKVKQLAPLRAGNIGFNILNPLQCLLITAFLSSFLFLIPPRLFNSPMERVILSMTKSNWPAWFSVEPGTEKYPHASSVMIIVRGKQRMKGQPLLFIRSEGVSWQKREFEKYAEKKQYFYPIDKLTRELEYFVSWGDLETEVFELVPVMAPQLGDFEIKLKYPDYTGLPLLETKGNPDIAALKGTITEFSAKPNKTLKKAEMVLDGKKYPVTMQNGRVSVKFSIDKNCNYGFILEAEDGSKDPEPPRYTVTVTEDQPPKIELISPGQDLVISDKSEIPLVFNASDDFMVTKIFLHYKIDNTKDVVKEINKQAAKSFQDTYEYLWKIQELNLKPSQKVYYYLEALDNDTVTGPKSAVSQGYSLETTNYEKEHDSIGASLKEFKKELLNILADQAVARDKVESLKVNYSTPTYNSLNVLQKAIKDNMQTPISALDKLLTRMGTDPFTDSSAFSEYKGMKSHLESMQKNPMEEAVKALRNKDFSEAKTNQDEIIAGLEKISLLSEDVWKYQKMRDTINTGAQLDKTAAELLDKLLSSPKPEDVKNTLDNIRGLLEKITNQLTKLPKELPEDFINSAAVKNIDLKQSQDLLGELSKAVAAGDWEKARKLAASLKEQLSSMLKTVHEVGKDIGFSSSMMEQMQAKANKIGENFKEIILDQKSMNKKTEAADDQLKKDLFKKQEDSLKQIAVRQKAVVVKAEKIAPRARQYYWRFADTVNLMKKVQEEFEQNRVYHSQKYLEDVIVDAASLERIIVTNSNYQGEPELKDNIVFIIKEEQAILELLKKPLREELFSQGQKDKLKNLSNEQAAVSKKARALRHTLEEFSRDSASISPSVDENLFSVQKEMEKASQQISGLDTPGAIESGYKALEYLENGQNGLEASKQAMSGQGKNAGKPVSGSIQIRTKGGAAGFYSVPVKLPDIDDYKPPREFRQEIMDALKERYPMQYEKIIKEYYKRIAQ